MTDMADTPDPTDKPSFLRHLPLIIIVAVAVIGAFTLRDYLSFETLRANREALLAYRDSHFAVMAVLFVVNSLGGAETGFFIVSVIHGSHKDHRNPRGQRICYQPLAHLDAVHSRHHHI